jgi:general secretion pathway protein B
MSFILDALKKSETDRQQQGSAEFAAVPTRPQSPSVPRWLWIVGVLLTINLAVLIGLLVRPGPVAAQQPPAPGASTAILPLNENPPAVSFAEQVVTAQQHPPERQLEFPSSQAQDVAQEFVQPVLISQNPSAIPASDLYPTIHEVRASGAIALPELHLDIHVFSPEPEDRFVFINMAKLREGSTLAEGPIVSEITPEGVVLQHLGQKFLVPRD